MHFQVGSIRGQALSPTVRVPETLAPEVAVIKAQRSSLLVRLPYVVVAVSWEWIHGYCPEQRLKD